MQKILATLFTSLALVLQLEAKPDKAIFFSSMPEAAMTYASMGLIQIFDLTAFRSSSRTFPSDTLFKEPFTRLVQNKDLYANFGYCDPSAENLSLLTGSLGKMVLHVCDPREALVRWVDFTVRHANHPRTLAQVWPVPPKEYWSWSFEQQADWQIDHFYQSALSWLGQWERALNTPDLQILVTRFEDMAADPLTFFKTVIGFYGGDADSLTSDSFLQFNDKVWYYNRSNPESWRYRLTQTQQERVNALLSDSMLSTYGWSR